MLSTDGLCECGCGRSTAIAQRTDAGKGWVKGEPLRYVRGHTGGDGKAGARRRELADEHRRLWAEEAPGVEYGYCQCGCGAPTAPAGNTFWPHRRVMGEPLRFVAGHRQLVEKGKRAVAYRVEDRGHETPCWIWTGHAVQYGKRAGRVGGPTERVYAYRHVYELHRGPVPDGLDLDHLCREPLCVNPDHLEPVTRRENLRRGAGTKLDQVRADEIRGVAEERPGLSQSAIGTMFGVGRTTVGDVLRGLRW